MGASVSSTDNDMRGAGKSGCGGGDRGKTDTGSKGMICLYLFVSLGLVGALVFLVVEELHFL